MSLFFNRIPPHVEAYLKRESRRRQKAVEEVALDALERGVAFAEDNANVANTGDEEATFIEDPNFDRALHIFAEIPSE